MYFVLSLQLQNGNDNAEEIYNRNNITQNTKMSATQRFKIYDKDISMTAHICHPQLASQHSDAICDSSANGSVEK